MVFETNDNPQDSCETCIFGNGMQIGNLRYCLMHKVVMRASSCCKKFEQDGGQI